MKARMLMALALFCSLLCVFMLTGAAADAAIGDLDGDGRVTFDDAQLIFDYVSGVGSLTREQLSCADIDGDGRVTAADAAQVFHYVTGVLRELPFVQRSGGVLTLLSLPDKITYAAGEELDLTGMTAAISYYDGTLKEITDYTVIGYEPTVGTKIIIISYEGMRTAFTVTVYPKAISEVLITSLPLKRTYLPGEALDLTGLEVTAYYDDGTYEIIESYAVSGFSGENGVNTIKIQYGSHTLSFDVTVGG